MARPTTLRGSKLVLLLGDGGTPETFTAPCALISKEITFESSVNEFEVPDCADPDAPVWMERVKSSRSVTVSGSGRLSKEALQSYIAAYEDNDPRNVQMKLDYTVAPVTWQGQFLVTSFKVTGENSALVEVEIELQSHGPVTVI